MEGASLTSFSPSVLIQSHVRERRGGGGGFNETGLHSSTHLTYSCAIFFFTVRGDEW